MVCLYIYSVLDFSVAEAIRTTVIRPHLFNSLFWRFKGHGIQGLVIPRGRSKKREMVQILLRFESDQTIQIAQFTSAVNPGDFSNDLSNDLSNEVALI